MAAAKMSGDIEKPILFQETGYREFLTKHLSYLRSNFGREFSLRKISSRAELSPGYLPQVLKGSIPLSEKAMNKLLPELKLTPAEQSCFRYMRIVSESEDQSERVNAFKKIQRFRDYGEHQARESEVFDYLSHWYYPVIREMAYFKEFKLDPKWIQPRLSQKIALKDIRKAVDFLLENGFLEKTDQSATPTGDKTIECNDGVFRLSMSQYHREMLGLIADSISTVERNKRKLRVFTVAITENEFGEAQEILDEAMERIKNLGQKTTNSGDIYSVHVSAVPLTKMDEA